jgi:hypothetical protein
MRKFARVIEGHAGNSTGCSDLSPSSNLMGCATVRKDVVALKADSVCAPPFCQSVPNPPMNVGTPWATIGRAANHAGQHSNKATTVWWIAGSGGGKGLWPVVALKQTPPHYRRNPTNPYAEKEARLRPQPFISSRSRMGTSSRCSCEERSRGPASAFRFIFGSGDYSFAQCKRKLQRLGG